MKKDFTLLWFVNYSIVVMNLVNAGKYICKFKPETTYVIDNIIKNTFISFGPFQNEFGNYELKYNYL